MKKAIAAVLTVVSISVMPVAAEINFDGANGIAARELSEIRDEIKGLSVPLPAPAALQQTKTPPVIGSYGWKHTNLKAADGTGISVDYNVFRAGDEIMADPVWVNVQNPVFSGGEKVRVVLINYFDSSFAVPNPVHSTQTVDLKYAGAGRFTVQINRVMMMRPEMNFRQEIAVVVDGKWLTDPVSGSNNFKFRMTW